MGGIERAQNETDGINTRKNTCQRLFANQTRSFYFAVLSCISFIMQTERARRYRHIRVQHTSLENVGESALSLYTPLCSDVVTWSVAIILVPNVLCS